MILKKIDVGWLQYTINLLYNKEVHTNNIKKKFSSHLWSVIISLSSIRPMIKENQQLVTNEPVEFEK